MSYILDALKKLEQEKTRKSRNAGKINISGELFGGENSRPAEGRSIKILLLVASVVLITFAVAWFLLIGPDRQKRVPVPISVTALPPAKSPLSVPTVSVAVPPAPVAPLQPQATSTPAPSAMTLPEVTSVASSAVPAEDEDEEREQRRSRRSVSAKKPYSPVLKSPGLTTVPAPADIQVSGIAWQDERRARRAVVNGFLMREGEVVSGAKITEILQNRVRFSLSGTSFEVTLLSAGLPSTGR